MAISQALRSKLSNLEDVPAALVNDVKKVQSQILAILDGKLDELKKVKGYIASTTANQKSLTKILNELYNDIIRDTEYASVVSKYVSGIDSQAALNNLIFTEIIGDKFVEGLSKQFISQQKRIAAESFITNASIEQSYVVEIRKLFNQGVSKGSNFLEFKETLKLLTVGDEKTAGLLQRHAKTIANDLFSITDRTYVEIVSEENGIEFFRYVGGRVDNTREFCRLREGQVFHINEIEAWGEIKTWVGRIIGTNSSNVFSRLGGHNCMHILSPLSILSVPKEVISRNIASGNYKPTLEDKELLEID